MDFSDALQALRDGHKVRRPFWQELDGQIGTWVELARPGPCGNGLQLPELLVCPLPGTGEAVLFACSQWDVLAGDWEVVPEGESDAGRSVSFLTCDKKTPRVFWELFMLPDPWGV